MRMRGGWFGVICNALIKEKDWALFSAPGNMYGSQKDDNDRYDDGNDEIGPRWPRYLVLPTAYFWKIC